MKPPYLLIGGAPVFKVLVLFVLVPALGNFASAHYALGFADDYDLLAKSLATGQGYRFGAGFTETMMREPGYPLVLAVAFKLLGYGIESARLANLLLASAAAMLLWHLALRVSRHAAVSVVAVVIFLLHPGTLIAEARGGVEIIFVCALLAFMLLLFRAIEADRAQHYFVAGLALGAVILVRSTPLLFPVVLLPYLLLTAPQGAKRRRLAQWALLVAGMGFVMSPWIARNYALSGQFVPTGTVQGVAAQEGLYTCERLWSGRDFKDLQLDAGAQRNRLASQLGLRFKAGYYQYFYAVADETAFNRALMQQTVARYRDDPGLLARCAGANLFHFWFLGKDAVAMALNVGLQLPLLALALAGAFVLGRRRPLTAWAPLALFLAYVVAVHLPIIAHARHGIPLVPFLGIFAGAALVAGWQRYMAGPRMLQTRPWLNGRRGTRPPQTA